MSVYFHEEDLPEGVLAPGPVAVDTETMGLHPGRDRLCLVQISDGSGDEHLVRFGPGSDYAAPNLKAVLADPARLKLYHFARFDLAVDPRLSRRDGRAGLLHQDRIAADPHLYRPPRPQGAGARAARPGNLQAAADRPTGARPSCPTRRRNMPRPTCAISTRCARSSTSGWRARAATRAGAGLLRFPAAPRDARSGRLARDRHLRPCLSLPNASGSASSGWAAPGGPHDRFVRLLKLALPAAIGVLMAYLLLSPLAKGQEISFILDKNKVEVAKERMRVQAAQYQGPGQSRPPVHDQRPLGGAGDARAIRSSTSTAWPRRSTLDTGPATLAARTARYNMENETVAVVGPDPVLVGRRLSAADARRRDRPQPPHAGEPRARSTAACRSAVSRPTGSPPTFPAATSQLSGRARLHIVQGSLR